MAKKLFFFFMQRKVVRIIFIIHKMDQTDRNFIDDMTKMIIRPHRDIYTIEKLGPPQMIVKGKTASNNDRPTFKYVEITRKDQAIDCKGKKIQLSYFAPTESEQKKNDQNSQQIKNKRCVVYLHANSGSRIEGLDLVKYVLPFGWSMAIFDYRGSGVSDGDYTSMGVNESQDLEKVLQHLSCHQRVTQYCLWGRSMGAVTILYYLTKQYYWNNLHSGITIRAVVMDSPFSNMQKLMYEVGSSKISLPDFVFTPVINSITERITMKLGFNLIKELDLIERVKQLKEKNIDSYKLMGKISALFITSLEDKLVNSSHVEALHQQYPFHPNDLHYFNGQHNDNRSDNLKNKCAQFLCEIPEKKEEERVTSPLLRRSQLDMRKVLEQPPKKELQFLLANKNINSPKFKPHKDIRAMTQDAVSNKKQVRTSKIIDQSRQNRAQTQNSPTIIINNNYNVSVNLFDGQKQPSQQIHPEIIPPINFRGDQMQGFMTDRMNDTHITHKYFGPYTAKVQKRQYEHITPGNIPFNISSPTNANNSPNISLFHKIDGNKTNQKEYLSTQNTKPPENKIDIPRIKFEGIDYNIEKEEDARQKLSSRDMYERRLGAPPQLMQQLSMYSSQPSKNMQNSEKSKLSLAQLRRLQKQQQEKCVMKTSKVISIKDRHDHSDQFQRIHLKSEGNQLEESLKEKEKPPQQGAERLSSTGSRQIRSLKTSLMQKRHVGNRKNSEASQNMKTSYMNQFNKRIEEKEKEKQFVGSPQKFLEYKVKIDHL